MEAEKSWLFLSPGQMVDHDKNTDPVKPILLL